MTPGKRLTDVILAGALLLIFALPICAIALLIALRDGRPVLYLSERMKTPETGFTLLKFRTMSRARADTGVSGGDKAGRITATGRWLRALRLDELPQLVNVLRGDMSFVGPRPPLRQYTERFPDLYRAVLTMRPGITGLATLLTHRREEALLAGCASAEETDAVYARRCVPLKARLDLLYAANRTWCWDMVILLRTVWRAARR
ncbi:sugar transferase [Poseidonocella sedimentorum]|uniref:Sugar transferase involved in LPS biosynthesis (Colanic, teichoic acid) n=1 Tax=Poseidonocella sedimentorum TaxID=871652 RepID=A0A1I6D8T9_9RHOB|nr:sugar transferase [Poseidonocella sedimentorum]SFR01818.1 Sugar transferase involved in LPS biosynthesis (colanic, teichoic acid) [Poseidonocella sedimentorum]